MAIEGDIQTVLAALVSGRAYPLVAPDPVIKPYIVYQIITEVTENTLEGDCGLSNFRVQVDAYADTYGAVKALGSKNGTIKAAMTAASFKALHLSSQDLHESETKLFRISMDFSVWG